MCDTDVDDLSTSHDESLVTGTEPSFIAVDAPVFAEESLVSAAVGSEVAFSAEAVESFLAEESSQAPTRGPSRRFENSINQGISQCRRETHRPSCSWRKGSFVTALFLTFERKVNDDICCCACSQVPECQAVHYERREGSCVFHQGPTLTRRRQSGTKRWVNQ